MQQVTAQRVQDHSSWFKKVWTFKRQVFAGVALVVKIKSQHRDSEDQIALMLFHSHNLPPFITDHHLMMTTALNISKFLPNSITINTTSCCTCNVKTIAIEWTVSTNLDEYGCLIFGLLQEYSFLGISKIKIKNYNVIQTIILHIIEQSHFTLSRRHVDLGYLN